MKPLLLFTTLALLAAFMPRPTARLLPGAWRTTDNGETTMLIVSENYAMQTTYAPARFLGSSGGTWKANRNALSYTIEFDTEDSTRVGQTEHYQFTLTDNQLLIKGDAGSQTFNGVDDSTGPMAGLWRITARETNNNQMTQMQRGPRKTLKLLTGTRFQWAAINPQTKQFSGSGGGTYTLNGGKYTETIDFFSRDNSRVGRSLTFDAEVKNRDWIHRGLSSTGSTVGEVWSRE